MAPNTQDNDPHREQAAGGDIILTEDFREFAADNGLNLTEDEIKAVDRLCLQKTHYGRSPILVSHENHCILCKTNEAAELVTAILQGKKPNTTITVVTTTPPKTKQPSMETVIMNNNAITQALNRKFTIQNDITYQDGRHNRRERRKQERKNKKSNKR